jgi:hypothetical protein
MAPEIVGDSFLIIFKNKQYSCQAIKANDRMLYRIDFNGTHLYITRTLNQHRIPFWTTIPQDLKLRQVAYELGNQIENHFN